MQVPLSHQTDIVGFHDKVTRLLAQQVPPEQVEWTTAAPHAGEEPVDGPGRATIHSRAARAIIPQSFVRTSELVVLHREPARFELLYRLLWRLVYEPELKHDFADADVARLRQMAQAVRRDIQKMKTRMQFDTLTLMGRTLRVCWYEPTHFVTEAVGGWLARRDTAGSWLLLTPDRSVYWDGRRLLAGSPLAAGLQPGQARPEISAATLEALDWPDGAWPGASLVTPAATTVMAG